jgi:hypothetical protein
LSKTKIVQDSKAKNNHIKNEFLDSNLKAKNFYGIRMETAPEYITFRFKYLEGKHLLSNTYRLSKG